MRLLSNASASTRIRIAPPVPAGLFAPETAAPPDRPSAERAAPTPRSIVPASAISWTEPPVDAVPAALTPERALAVKLLNASAVAAIWPPLRAKRSMVPPCAVPPVPVTLAVSLLASTR